MKSSHHRFGFAAAALLLLAPGLGGAQTAAPKYAPDVPAKITTPDTVPTRIGTLRWAMTGIDPKRASTRRNGHKSGVIQARTCASVKVSILG